jgi:hypothetical protein
LLFLAVNNGVRLKHTLQHTRNWWTAAWTPLRLCYRPAVFVHHIHLSGCSLPQRKIWCF